MLRLVQNLFIVVALFVIYPCYAQKNPIVGVPLFDFKESNNLNLANQVTEFVLNLLKNSGRYTIVDMTSEEQRKVALERAQENYKAENWLDSYKASNAEMVLGGEITSIKFVKSTLATEPGYRAAITLTLKIIQVETGEIMHTANFETTKSPLRLTPETALASSLQSIGPNIIQFFKEHVKQTFPIVKFNEIIKEKVASFTCRIPLVLKFELGDKLKLVYYETMGNKSIPQLIGEAKIKEHIAEDFWLVVVTKGGAELFKFKNHLETIQCTE